MHTNSHFRGEPSTGYDAPERTGDAMKRRSKAGGESPDGDTIIELKVKPEQVPNILNNLGISEKASALIDVRNSASVDGKAMIPDDYGVQLQINLTVEETGALNPSVTLNVQPTHKIFLL